MAKATLERIEVKNLGTPEEVRPFKKGRLEVVHLNGALVGRATFEPGWKWSESVKPLAGTPNCQAAHLGYQLSGKMQIVMEDGTKKVIGPGDAFKIPAGHDAWVVGDEPVVVVDFQGMVDYAKKR